MTEFTDEDLNGARFERSTLNGTHFHRVTFDDATFRHVHLNRTEIRGAMIDGARWYGVELSNVVINGALQHVIVNGVDIGPLVEAELNRRDPDRPKMRPTDPDGFRDAWSIVTRRWDETVERARTLPTEALHARVNGEWSFIETLRHLGFATAAWVGRMILGDPSPWHPLDLPWDEAPGWDGIPWDRDVQPPLDEVVALRHERREMVARVLDELTPEHLASEVTRTEPGWPQLDGFPFAECLLIVLNEEWEHRNYAERDLELVLAAAAS
jgi:hypothetical protein